MKIVVDKKGFMPARAHKTDAGMDLRSPIDVIVGAHGSAIIDTGVHVEIPYEYSGLVKSKSGLNVRHNIITDGVVDTGYTGSVVVKLYNLGDIPYEVHRGDKIAQLVIASIIMPDLEKVDELTETERGDNGFGSTGR